MSHDIGVTFLDARTAKMRAADRLSKAIDAGVGDAEFERYAYEFDIAAKAVRVAHEQLGAVGVGFG